MSDIKAWQIAYVVAFGLAGAALPSVGSAEYRLAPGDVIEVGVATSQISGSARASIPKARSRWLIWDS